MAYTYRYIETNAISYEGDSVFHLLGVIDIFIAITTYKHLTEADLQHFIEISKGIDGLLFRTPMSSDDLFSFRKINRCWFPKDKIIIHSDVDLLESLTLKRLHCREMDTLAFDYKRNILMLK